MFVEVRCLACSFIGVVELPDNISFAVANPKCPECNELSLVKENRGIK